MGYLAGANGEAVRHRLHCNTLVVKAETMWAQLINALLGVWLMAAPAVLGYIEQVTGSEQQGRSPEEQFYSRIVSSSGQTEFSSSALSIYDRAVRPTLQRPCHFLFEKPAKRAIVI
jgi:hypothetical protein